MKRPVYPATIAAHDALTDTLDGWPDLADECPDFIEPADDAEDAEWLMLMAVVEDDWSAWEAEVSA